MPTAGIYTYKDGDASGKVSLVQETWGDKKLHWVIKYDQGFKPPSAGLTQSSETVGTGSDQDINAEITNGSLKLVKESFAPTPVKAGRRRTRRKSRARKSRRSRK